MPLSWLIRATVFAASDQSAESRRIAEEQHIPSMRAARIAKQSVEHDRPNALADHDILIEIKTKLEGLKADVQDLKDGTSRQITDHEQRLNMLETSKTRQTTLLTIGTGILTLLVSLLIYHLIGK